jgi:hypothetical protein
MQGEAKGEGTWEEAEGHPLATSQASAFMHAHCNPLQAFVPIALPIIRSRQSDPQNNPQDVYIIAGPPWA